MSEALEVTSEELVHLIATDPHQMGRRFMVAVTDVDFLLEILERLSR
jgi:hypothetical protein